MKHPLDIDFTLLDKLRNRAVAVKARDDAEAAAYQQRKEVLPPLPVTVRSRTPAPVRHDRGYEDTAACA